MLKHKALLLVVLSLLIGSLLKANDASAAGSFLTSYMSLAASVAPVTHTSSDGSPLQWKVHRVVAPSGMVLRSGRWTFDVGLSASGGEHVGTVALGPSNGGLQDSTLDALCAASSFVVVQVRFSSGQIHNLPVQLSP